MFVHREMQNVECKVQGRNSSDLGRRRRILHFALCILHFSMSLFG
jgi:hypothetical protein